MIRGMKLGLAVAITVGMICAATPAAAQIAAGTVDVEKIRGKSDRFQQVFEEIDDMVADFERRRDKKRDELDGLAQELQQNSERESRSSMSRMQRSMAEKSRNFQEFMEETFGTDGIIEAKSAELLAPLYDDLAEAAKKVARSEGLDLIIDIETLNPLYASDDLDVTDLVLKEFVRMR